MPFDIRSTLEEFDRTVEGSPDADALRLVRDTLDDASFASELERYVDGINDPDALNGIIGLVKRLLRKLEDRSVDRAFQRDVAVQIGVVGGVGLIGGSIVAAATATFPAIVLIPIVGGAWMALIGYAGGRRLNQEAHIYRHLAERLKELLEAIE